MNARQARTWVDQATYAKSCTSRLSSKACNDAAQLDYHRREQRLRPAPERAAVGKDPRFLTPELRLRHLEALHRIVQEWIWTFGDMESLDAQLDEAKIATGRVRSVREFADSDWARQWNAVRAVSDRSGGEIKIPGRPWHFADQVAADEGQLVARQGEHNAEVLSELGFSAAEIAALEASGALVQPDGRSCSG